jgi:porin
MFRVLFILLVFFCSPVYLLSQPVSDDSSAIIRPEVAYVGEVLNNFTGGIRTGSCYLGMANIRIAFFTGAAHLWRGGELYINGANTHGAEPSVVFLGDLQVASNIEAGNHTFVQEMWYKQSWNSIEITAGLQDLNVYFVNSSNCGLFLNSSFGVLPTVSGNIPAPIFPLTSLGLSVKWKPSSKYTLLSALYDGSATNFKENPYNLNWHPGMEEGMLLFNEIQHEVTFGNLPGMYKAGIYMHQHFRPETEDHDSDVDTSFRNNNGLYLIGDQMIWQNQGKERNLGAFMQFGFSPRKQNLIYYYIGFGLKFTGLISKQGKDIAGLAIAHVGLRGYTGSETTLEFTYQYEFFHFLYLQPDVQYIINPAGTGKRLKNCLAVSLRFGISL